MRYRASRVNSPVSWFGWCASQYSASHQDLGGFDFIYGHTSAPADGLEEGSIVYQGDLIGYSGQDKDGNVHLHLEIRPAPSDGKTKSFFVINPLTFFSPELQDQWVPIFNGDPNAPDYLNSDDSLSLGYYRNTPLPSCETKK